ncbi:MAG: DUF5627 domain-containing protein [Paludibacter sp.]|nr:DUF5627 domain-containing protein [Paludibacter sp.]
MKKIFIALTLIVALAACKNQDIDFPDFTYTAAYFPYQYPVRTLVLGDYIYDNTNDNNHKFVISAAFGGVYTNTENRVLNFQLDESLCNKALFSSTFTTLTDTIRVMPASYYTLSSTDKITIPAGKFNGGIEVQLKDAFFDDPLSIKLGYVIPLRIVSSSDVDSILKGKAAVANPDPRIVANWGTVPKDYTMFAVKYINPYDAQYLHRGVSVVKDASDVQVEKTVYRTTYIEQNELWRLKTTAKNQVAVSGTMRSTKFSGTINLLLDFTEDGNCTVKQDVTSRYTITGTGKFVKNSESWGNQPRNAIYLNYQFSNGTYTYNATDTLVVRDRAVVLETYTPTIFN